MGTIGTRARVSADAVINAEPRQQGADKDEQNADRTRQLVAAEAENIFQHIAEKLSDTADKPARRQRRGGSF